MIVPDGDPNETTSTQWYHDHAMDITGPNVNMGLAGFFLVSDGLENQLKTSGKLPGDAFDIPVVIQDKRLSSTGQVLYDSFEHDGFLGNLFVVNGKVQPQFHVRRRKYRLRFLNGSNARIYKFKLSSGSFLQIGNDSWLLPNAVARDTFVLAPAQRAEMIVDFRNAPAEVFLYNRFVQNDGRGPDGEVSPGTPIMKFVVDQTDTPDNNATIAPGNPLRPNTPIRDNEIVQTRLFEFARSHGAWVINESFFDPFRIDARPKKGTAERWILKNSSGGWWHPIHIHLEAHQVQSFSGEGPTPLLKVKNDTVLLGPNATAVVYIKFRTFPGKFAFHCHNLEHEDMRMMGVFNVEE